MTRTPITRLAILAAIIVAAAVGLNVALRNTRPFDQGFEICDADSAEWKLVVHYRVCAREQDHHYEAHYRRRDVDVFAEPGWLTGNLSNEWIEVGGPGAISWFSSGCGRAGGGSSEFITISPTENAAGVALDIEHEYRAGNRETKTAEQIQLPFRRNLHGTEGDITYDATWTQVVRK